MLYFFLQFLDTIQTHKIYIFEMFVFYAWIIYLIKLYYAKKYRPCINNFHATTSVIVPVFRENSNVFEKCLKSIKEQSPNEFFVILDKLENDKELRTIASKYATVIKAENEGKREAVFLGVKKSISEVVVLVDSDTIFTTNSLSEMIKPFIDIKVGGVTSKQKIFNQKGNIVRRIAAWMEDVRFSIGSIPSQSYFNCVGCLPGRAIAFRRTYLLNVLEDFINQTFLGNKMNSGDDRVLTNLILKSGYKTVYQSTSLVYTDCPNTFKTFVRQQLRWSRSSQRETILSLKWICKFPMTAFIFITDILTPFLFVIVMLDSVYRYMIGEVYFDIPLSLSIIMAIIGMNLTLMLKQFPYIKLTLNDLPYIPLYVFFMTFIMTPIRIMGFFTMNNSGWMTRNKLNNTIDKDIKTKNKFINI